MGAIVQNQTKPAEKFDRRQRRTRRAIYEAFEELIAEKHYSRVTVAELIERADVGRSTLYAHFETKDELLEDMCSEMFAHIFEGVNEYCTSHAGLETASLAGKLAHLLYHLRDTHAGVCGKLVREGEPHFTACFERHLAEFFEREDGNEGAEVAADMPQSLATEIRVAAFSHTMAWWFAREAQDVPEDVARWFCATMFAHDR